VISTPEGVEEIMMVFSFVYNFLNLIMRLKQSEIDIIRDAAIRHFGTDVQVFLFGSRTDDKARGGDIDLYITTIESGRLSSIVKNAFITDLIMRMGDRRIDVVLDNEKRRAESFYKTIERTSIRL